jgi:hypothetical protein
MDDLEFIEELAGIARRRPPPSVDVVDRVMHRIEAAAAPKPDGSFWPLAVGVSLAAIALFLLALQSLAALDDPIVEILDSVKEVFS